MTDRRTATRHQLIGSAFDNLMEQRDEENMVRSKGISETEDALLQPNANPLFPKLIYAKHTTDDLLDDTEGVFEAHLTFIIDYFGTTVATRHHEGPQWSSSLHNLLAEYVTESVEQFRRTFRLAKDGSSRICVGDFGHFRSAGACK